MPELVRPEFASVDFAFIVVAVVEFADKAGVAVSTLVTITIFILIKAATLISSKT